MRKPGQKGVGGIFLFGVVLDFFTRKFFPELAKELFYGPLGDWLRTIMSASASEYLTYLPVTLLFIAGVIAVTGWGVNITIHLSKPHFRSGKLVGVPTKVVDDIASSDVTGEWYKEWHELRFRRNDFWLLINRAYDYWKPSEHLLQEIISKARIPTALPLDDNSAFPQWVWDVKDLHSDGWSVALNEFAKAIYDDERSNLQTLVFGGPFEFDRFDDIRRELSKFWDRWGRQQNADRLAIAQNMENPLQSSAAELKLLTFLEIARGRWNPTGASGKSGLFALARKSPQSYA